MVKTKISIITVTYNSSATIQSCLDSIASQNYQNIEHIVIDGSSTDKTLEIINNHSYKPSIIISEKDNGIYEAMNKGIKIAKNDIIGFLNSDDIYANNYVLSKVANVFNNLSIDGCYADLIYTHQTDTTKTIRYWKSSKFTPGLFTKGWCPPHPTFFVRRSVYEQFGTFNLNYRIASDVELMMRLLEVQKINVSYIPELWIKMRFGGTTNKNFKNIVMQNREVLYALKNHNLSVNWISFFVHKTINRVQQFLKKN
jgi:glycosyltransferase involved in cell wall biosynthesis